MFEDAKIRGVSLGCGDVRGVRPDATINNQGDAHPVSECVSKRFRQTRATVVGWNQNPWRKRHGRGLGSGECFDKSCFEFLQMAHAVKLLKWMKERSFFGLDSMGCG